MLEPERQKIERQYRRYRMALEGDNVGERSIVRFLAWLEGKAGYTITPPPSATPPTLEGPGQG